MDINVFLLCYNESVLLPHVVKHYKKYLPSCKITIYDNESSDNSVEIAKSLGCSVVSWKTDGTLNEFKLTDIKNNCWKSVKNGWVIVADMDEFLCVTEKNLLEEFNKGVSILAVRGLDMIGESKLLDLSDIDLQLVTKYVDNIYEYKWLCFLREKINDMNYDHGAHSCQPSGDIVFSSNEYINKHMSDLGLQFIINKNINRFNRSRLMHRYGLAQHYSEDIAHITKMYTDKLKRCSILE